MASGLWEAGMLSALDTSQIREDLSHAWMLGESAHPADGETRPDEEMRGPAYSWCKAPRLNGQVFETGALARQVVVGHPLARDLARRGGVVGRVGGRLLELALTQIEMERLLAESDSANVPVRPDVPRPEHVISTAGLRLMEIDWQKVGERLPAVQEELKELFVD